MTQEEKVRMCYFTNWSQSRKGTGRFKTRRIDPFLCTHILYAYADIDADNNTLKLTDKNDPRQYTKIIALKEQNPQLKVLLAVGGGSHGTQAFEEVSTSKERVVEFAKNTIAFLRTNGFDGLAVDWVFPTEETKDLYRLFVQQVSVLILIERIASGRDKLELTIGVSGDPSIVTTVYQPKEIVKCVDYVLLMSYDLWGTWSTTLGHHSPLHPVLPNHPEQGRYSMSQLVTAWTSQGFPKDKLVLGLSTYGHTGVMSSPALHHPGDTWARDMGLAGPIVDVPGLLSYSEICKTLTSRKWKHGYSPKGQVPYAWNPTTLQYLCYDNPQSFQAKAQYIVKEGLAGAMFWSLDYDDFTGRVCRAGPYPLIKRAKNALNETYHDDPSMDNTSDNYDDDNNNNNNIATVPPAQAETHASKPTTTTIITATTNTITTENTVVKLKLCPLPAQSNMAPINGFRVCVLVIAMLLFIEKLSREILS